MPWTSSAPRTVAGTITALTCAAGLAACTTVPTGTQYRGDAVEVPLGDLTAEDVADAGTAFGLDLLHQMCATDPGANVLVSPVSVMQALGLLQPAAADGAERELADLLHLPSWSPDLVAALQQQTALLDELADGGARDDTVRISNRIWTAEGVQPTADYLDAVATAYDAGLEALDFAGDPEAATDRINAAVSGDTAGLIPELYPEPLDRGTAVVLTNAVHLRADWATEFDEARPGPFEAPGGEVTADLMTGGAGTVRLLDDGWTGVEIPYEDGTLVALAVLPPPGTDPCTVDAARVAALSAGSGVPAYDAVVTMPRLRLERGYELDAPLAELGLPLGGEFPGFGVGGLGISRVVHRTYLEADE